MLHYQLLVTNNKLSQGLPNQIIAMFDVFSHTNMQQCKSNGGHQPEREMGFALPTCFLSLSLTLD